MSNLIILAPFALLLVIIGLANLADGRRARGLPGTKFAIASYVLLVISYLGLIAVGLAFEFLGRAPLDLLPPAIQPLLQTVASVRLFALGLWAPSLLGILLLLRPVRRMLARLIPIDPASTVHATAASYMALVLINLLATLGLGLENIANELGNTAQTGIDGWALAKVWAQEIFWVVLAMVGVGMFSRRNLSETLHRLGLVTPTMGQALLGIGVGVALVPLAALIIGLAMVLGIPIDAEVQRLSERLFGPLAGSVPGILTLGLAAALGEETLLRGALQPRFGLILTSVLFALLHSTYGLTIVTLVVLVVGLVLGIVRRRNNTVTSMFTHATYNTVMAVLGLIARSYQP